MGSKVIKEIKWTELAPGYRETLELRSKGFTSSLSLGMWVVSLRRTANSKEKVSVTKGFLISSY